MSQAKRSYHVAVIAASASLIQVVALAQGIAKPDQPQSTPATGGSADSIAKIADDYNRQLLELDRGRLERLTRLAAGQQPADAAATYEQLFHLAIAGNLFREVEPAAKAVVDHGSASTPALALAHLVKMIAECDRGAYDQSLETLRTLIVDKAQDPQLKSAKTHLLSTEKNEICDAYYQRLIHADQYDVARKALTLIKEQARDPEVAAFVAYRLARLEMVGKPAPALQAADLDGKKFNLADSKGKVVLLVYWATWNLPSEAEIATLREVDQAFQGKGLEIVAINVDAMQEGGVKPDALTAGLRRYLLDHNVHWPNLISTPEHDLTRAFGVNEIPANILVDKDGKVAGIDLVRQNLAPTIGRLIGR